MDEELQAGHFGSAEEVIGCALEALREKEQGFLQRAEKRDPKRAAAQIRERRKAVTLGGLSYKLALWLFGLLVLVKVVMSVNCIFNGYSVASRADGIPLDTFTSAGARAVVSLFAIWGLAHLVICLLCILVLVRYRTMVPFMFALLLLEHLSRKLVLQFMPIVRTGTPPGSVVNFVLLAVMIVGLVLSLRGKDYLPLRIKDLVNEGWR